MSVLYNYSVGCCPMSLALFGKKKQTLHKQPTQQLFCCRPPPPPPPQNSSFILQEYFLEMINYFNKKPFLQRLQPMLFITLLRKLAKNNKLTIIIPHEQIIFSKSNIAPFSEIYLQSFIDIYYLQQ